MEVQVLFWASKKQIGHRPICFFCGLNGGLEARSRRDRIGSANRQDVDLGDETPGRSEPRWLATGGQVLFWATLNPFGVSNKAISSEVAFFVFWRQCATDASIDARQT